MWASIGAAVGCIFNGANEAAVVLLLLALVCWPFRMKFTVHRIQADSFEQAMREIAEMEKGDRQ